MPSVFQCQIELRVPKDRFDEALLYYTNLFKLPDGVEILVPGELAQAAYAEFAAGGQQGKYAVVIRGMKAGYRPGAVAHWGWVRQDDDGKPQTIEQDLSHSSGGTIHLDELTGIGGGLLERISGIDAFQNRVGSINPDFPGFIPRYSAARKARWGTVLGLLGLGVAGALVWRGAGTR